MTLVLSSVQRKIEAFIEKKESEKVLIDAIDVANHFYRHENDIKPEVVYENLEILIQKKKVIKTKHIIGTTLHLRKKRNTN